MEGNIFIPDPDINPRGEVEKRLRFRLCEALDRRRTVVESFQFDGQGFLTEEALKKLKSMRTEGGYGLYQVIGGRVFAPWAPEGTLEEELPAITDPEILTTVPDGFSLYTANIEVFEQLAKENPNVVYHLKWLIAAKARQEQLFQLAEIYSKWVR